jgi:hypothetical protein
LEEIAILTYAQIKPRNISNLKKQGNMTPPKAHNTSITESKNREVVRMSDNSKVYFFLASLGFELRASHL